MRIAWLGIVLMVQSVSASSGEQPEPVDRVADALAVGEAGDADGSGAALLSAARRLDRLAAHPLEGEADLAARWRRRGGMLGAQDRMLPMRGRALGPAYRSGQLGAGARIDIEQIFLGGEAAVVVVVPQKGRSLQIRISDVDRSLICGQMVQPPKTACRWMPVFTTRFRISVTNPEASPARYYLVSN